MKVRTNMGHQATTLLQKLLQTHGSRAQLAKHLWVNNAQTTGWADGTLDIPPKYLPEIEEFLVKNYPDTYIRGTLTELWKQDRGGPTAEDVIKSEAEIASGKIHGPSRPAHLFLAAVLSVRGDQIKLGRYLGITSIPMWTTGRAPIPEKHLPGIEEFLAVLYPDTYEKGTLTKLWQDERKQGKPGADVKDTLGQPKDGKTRT